MSATNQDHFTPKLMEHIIYGAEKIIPIVNVSDFPSHSVLQAKMIESINKHCPDPTSLKSMETFPRTLEDVESSPKSHVL